MNCRIVDMRNKDVINVKDGTRLGYVSDVEVDTANACLVAIVIYGRPPRPNAAAIRARAALIPSFAG